MVPFSTSKPLLQHGMSCSSENNCSLMKKPSKFSLRLESLVSTVTITSSLLLIFIIINFYDAFRARRQSDRSVLTILLGRRTLFHRYSSRDHYPWLSVFDRIHFNQERTEKNLWMTMMERKFDTEEKNIETMNVKNENYEDLDSVDAATDVANNFKQIKESTSTVVCRDEELEREMSDAQKTD